MSLNCRVFRDEKGQIDFVNAPNGNRSKLFDTLVNITGGNKNTALNIYALTETEELKDAVKVKINSFKERFKNVVKIAPSYSNMNTPIEEVRFSKTANTSGYFSNALSAISNLSDKNPKNTQGWIKQLTDVQKNGGVKNVNQELQWIGLEDYLNDYVKENSPKAGNIPFSVVEDYIKSNQIEIIDVSKGKPEIDINDLEAEFDGSGFKIRYYGEGRLIMPYITLDQIDLTEEDTYEDDFDYYSAQEAAKEAAIAEVLDREDGDVKYSGYQLKGGENYREVLLTMPNKEGKNPLHEKRDQLSKQYREAFDSGNYDLANEIDNQISDITKQLKSENSLNTTGEKAQYKSSHWDEANILAHVRLNEKTLPDGRKVLIVNEIQSDWAQEGRKKGFKKDTESVEKVEEDYNRWLESNNIPYTDMDMLEAFVTLTEQQSREYSVLLERYDVATGKMSKTSNIPYANTDQWVGLVTRRVMQMASQEGYDGIAFATGQQSADMYSLARQADELRYSKNSDGTYNVNIFKDSGSISSQSNITEVELENYVGKEIAQRIVNNEGEQIENEVSLTGVNLEVGGEGMKTFYDKIVPKVAQKEAQRFDKNAKLETVDFGGEVKNKLSLAQQPYIAITDKMRSELQEAIPLFSKNKGEQAPKEVIQEVADRLKQSGLAKNVYQMSNSEINEKLKELGEEDVDMTTAGFTYQGDVYLNTDVMGLDTPIHEFGHLHLDWLKENRTDLYQAGLSLIEKNKEEAQQYINIVKETQPDLKEGTEKFNNEVLAQVIGDQGARLVNSKKDNSIADWIKNVWEAIRDILGLSNYTAEQVANMTLAEFGTASAAEMLSGKVIKDGLDFSTFLPNKVISGVNEELVNLSEQYKKENNLPLELPRLVISLSEKDAMRVADAYDEMKHDPNNPKVQLAYNSLITEIKKQADLLLNAGYKFELSTKERGYNSSSEMIKDVKDNKHIFIDPSSENFGTTREFNEGNIGLADSGYKDINGNPLTNVEVIRAVHDVFGHAKFGTQFGAIGEENAWRVHMSMFSPEAQKALTATTRGQNSWVNFGKHMRKDGKLLKKGDEGYMSPTERPFAEQKIGLLPEWTTDNSYGDVVTINGKTIIPVNKYSVLGEDIYEIADGKAYYDAILSAKNSRLGTEIPEDVRDGIQVYVKSEEDYQNIIDKGGKLLVSKDGLTGVMIEADGNIGSGFNHSSNTKPNSLAPYLVAGIKMGARYTDAYDTYLPKYYAKFGFVASERMKFNEEYAEDGWDKSILKTKPDVVFMYFDGGDRMTIEDRVGTFEPYKKTDGQYIEDYDQGVENAKNKTSKEASLLPLVSKDSTSDVNYSMISDGERKLYEDEVKRKEGFALSQNTNWARDEWFKMLVYSDNKTIMKMTEKAAPTLLIKVAEQYNLPLKGSNLKLAAMSAVRKEASRQNREMFGVDFSKTTKNPLSISPENSSNYANLTEDGQGNFVFYHVGNSGYETIKRSSGGTTATSREEAQALSKVGGLAMYYTRPEDGESMVKGESKYMVKIPMGKVYDFNTDSLGLTQKAKELHSKEHPGKAFDANTQVAYVTKLAGELGYEMVVAEWANRTRAQSIKELAPVDTQVVEGSSIRKPFQENYDSNSTKGFKSVIPIPKDEQLKQLYLDLNNYRNRENRYDNVYRLYEENTKLSQEEITDRIKNSDLPQEYKSKYESILNTPEERRRSTYPISKSVKRTPSLELNGTKIFAKERVNPITGESMGDIEWELIESTERGQGNARKAAEIFLNGTDAQGKDVYLTISPRDAQTSPERLESFYSSLGFKKVSDFEMIRKAKPITPKDVDSNGEVSVKALMDFSNSKVKPLGLEGLKAAKNAAMALKVKSSDELIEKMEKALMKNGIVLFDKLSLQRSKLYNTFEINTILSSPSLQKQIKESLLSLKNSEPFQIDYNENFIVPQGREVNQFGKQEVLNPSTVEKDLIESVAGLSEDEIDEALPAAFSNRYYTDSDFRETVDSIARDYKKAPVKEIVEGELVDKTEDVKGMLTNTLTEDFNESIAEDIRFLREEIDEEVFNSNLTKVSKILNKIKKNAYINGIDLRNFPTLALELSRSEILGFLDSMEDMLSEPYNQDAFDEFSDRYFEILGEKEPKTEVIKSNSQNDVFVDEPLSEYEMFSKFGLVKKQDNVYRKVTDTPLETLYENFFEHKNLLPEGVDSIDNLKVYVQKNTGALEVSDYEVDVDNLEKMFLYKKFFGFPMSTVKTKVNTEGINKLTNSEEYLTGDFVKDFNKWVLATGNAYFKVTNKGIELTQKDELSKSEAIASVPVRFKQDLAEYNIISNNLNLELPLEEEKYRDVNTQYEERQKVVNNPDRVKKITGQYTYLKDGVLAVKNEGATFVRTPIGVFEKIFEFANIKFYGKLDTETTKGYKKIVADAPFSDINFNNYMYLENTPEAFKNSKNYYSRKELDDINEEYFGCQ